MNHPQTALLATLSLTLGCAPEVADLAVSVEALTGPAPTAPTSWTAPGSMTVNDWSLGAGGNQWSDIVLADVDHNGYDDLCGYYGDAWGCALRLQSTRFEGFVEAREVRTFRRGTLRLLDVTGDGRMDVCGRTSAGYRCLYADVSAGPLRFVEPTSLFGGPLVHVPAMSDSAYWNQPQYETTVVSGPLAALGGRTDLCARGVGGVMCYFGFDTRYPMAALPIVDAFRDADGWSREDQYATIALADIDGDGDADLCGRRHDGIICARYDKPNARFLPATRWTTQFRNADGWSDPRYYRSIRFGDIDGDGDADVCGRGYAGVHCGLSDRVGSFQHADDPTPDIPGFSDAAGFDAEAFRGTLTLRSINGDRYADVCMMGPHRFTDGLGYRHLNHELYCARSRGGAAPSFESASRRTELALFGSALSAGVIFPSRPSFCWVGAGTGSVRCANLQ